MGVWPAIYASLMIPSGKSENKVRLSRRRLWLSVSNPTSPSPTQVPAWPFVAGSVFFGAFALLPYMALWQPLKDSTDARSPPPPEDLEGAKGIMLKGLESPVTPVLLLGAAAYQFYQVATAGPAQWSEFSHLFDESRFTHVMSLDFLMLTTLAPFWMSNDATVRNWDKKDSFLPALSWIPVFGPLVYLLLRPRTPSASKGTANQ